MHQLRQLLARSPMHMVPKTSSHRSLVGLHSAVMASKSRLGAEVVRLPCAVMHRVIWTPARLGGPNCNSACRSYGGGSNRSFMAVNTGTGVRPYFLCRAPVSGCPRSAAR